MKQSIQTIVAALTVLSLATIANAQGGGAVISSTSPSSITLLNASSTNNYAYVTLTGTNLSTITDARCTLNGTEQKLIGAVIQHVAIVKGKTTLQSFLDNPPIVIKVSVLSGTPSTGNYALEVFSNKRWMSANCAIKVVPKFPPVSSVSSVSRLLTKQFNLSALSAIQSLSAKSIPTTMTIPTQLKKTTTVPKIQLTQSTLPQATVTDYYPKSKGALGGTLVLEGKNLDSIKQVKIGNTVLTFSKKIVRGTSQPEEAIYLMPTGGARITGGLVFVATFQLNQGGQINPNSVTTLESNYSVANQWTELVPKVSVESVSTFTNADGAGNLYPYQHFLMHVFFENIPGSSFPNDFNILQGSGAFLEANDRPQLDVDDFTDNAELYYGNRFDAYVEGKSLSENLTSISFSFTPSAMEGGVKQSKLVQLSVPLQLTAPQDYTIDNTFDLKDLFKFSRTSAWGQTEGTSDFGCGAVSVGEINNGGDIAFRIASGPIGTEGRWQSNLLNLADGWTVKKMTFEVSKVDPDGSQKVRTMDAQYISISPGGSFDFARGVDPYLYPEDGFLPDPSNLNSSNATAMLYMENSVTDANGQVYPSTPFTAMQMMMRPIAVDLQADATLCNDHRITLTLKSISLRGPRSHTAKDGFTGSVNFPTELNPMIVQGFGGVDISAVRFF